jgi:hypothetical protein
VRSRSIVLFVVVLMLVATVSGAARSSRPAGASPASDRVSASFDPLSVSFTSPSNGWTLGLVPCAHDASCLALRSTTDDGRSWQATTLPSLLTTWADRNLDGTIAATYGPGSLSVRFANGEDGWIFGTLPGPVPKNGVAFLQYKPVLWSTHDGGQIWTKLPVAWVGRYGTIFDLEAAAGTVYVMGENKSFHVTVRSSPIGIDEWRTSRSVLLGLPAGGAQPNGAFVLRGTNGWLVVGNDRGISGSARLASDGAWVAWTPPCEAVGNSYVVPAASTSRRLVAICQMGGFAYGLSKSAPPGAKLGSNWLYFSDDGGSRFTAGSELLPTRDYAYGVLASPRPGVILIDRWVNNKQELVESFDNGAHWSVTYNGDVISLAFTGVNHGVGIVRAGNGVDSMIMTVDGGHHWQTVDA